MPSCSFFAPVVHTVTRNTPQRLFRSTPRLSSTLSPTADVVVAPSTAEPPPVSPRDFLRDRKIIELKDSLSRRGNPSRVWAYYTSALNVLGYEKLPLEIHQQVLRRCTASSRELRVSATRRLEAGNKPSTPHIYEGRFQAVIRNIRAMSEVPDLEDYHFILEQFAAVGHHVGVMHVYKELNYLGLIPRTKTFGLCLQAIAHRLTLPEFRDNRERRLAQTRLMLSELISDMQKLAIPFTSVNLDLTIRILKDTLDMEGFESLMRWGYGIDLSNPDRAPLEYLGPGTISSDLGLGEQTIQDLPQRQRFSTPALNTTLDVLGRMGNISKLIEAFEVLTQPLPQANQHLFNTFDDEDDFGLADGPPALPPPCASPNTTSYNTLLRYICRSGHATLARHYFLEAMWLDRHTDSRLRRAILSHPLHKVFAPHFAINRGTLLPAFGESNRDKNIGLMRWLSTKLPSILKRKRGNHKFYSDHRDKLTKRREALAAAEVSNPEPNSAFLPASSLPDTPRTSVLERRRPPKPPSTPVLELDVDVPPETSPPPPIKYLDLNLHIRMLERDIDEIEAFQKHVELVLGRNTQRLKERLGRRVWNDKDIYLSTHGRRLKVDRERWKEIVQFKSRQGVDPFSRTPSLRSRETSIPNRSFSTFFQSNKTGINKRLDDTPQPESTPPRVLTHLSSMFHRR